MIKINLENIKNIGPKRLDILHKMNIFNVEDLLEYYPYKYQILEITPLLEDNTSIINAKVITTPVVSYIKKNLNSLKFKVEYNNSFINVVIFNRAFLKNNIQIGKDILLIGKYVKLKNQFIASDIRLSKLEKKEIIAKYHLISGIKNNTLKNIIDNVLANDYDVIDYTPDIYNKKYNFITKKSALKIIHQPNDLEEIKKAKLKLIYEELFIFTFKINYLKMLKSKETSFLKRIDTEKEINDFINKLPFELTKDQLSSVKDIQSDFINDKRMNRLLLGDVGSGKTIVSVIALYSNFLSGYQGALMAPTEVLATQHFNSIISLLKDYKINVEILVGSMTKKEKTNILNRLKNKEIDIIIGTHSIISDDVEFNNLGLVITDEQHRFGVNQRKNLQNKGFKPDVLYLSATPIPRTYALTLYGDMDISIIKTKPKNRLPVKTYLKNEKEIKDVLMAVYENIKKGNQIYVVAPAIETEEDNELNDVKNLKEKFAKAFQNKVRIEILHSKIKAKEKDAIMNDFQENKIQILISTTVIEVGIDNPNATIMIIFNAERFGLATLHQLRGRVGRGDIQSYCYLISNQEKERLKIMTESNDGFYIADKDYELRGEGDIFGERQSGDMIFKIAELKRDRKILLKSKEDSEKFIKENVKNNFENYKKYQDIIDSINFIN